MGRLLFATIKDRHRTVQRNGHEQFSLPPGEEVALRLVSQPDDLLMLRVGSPGRAKLHRMYKAVVPI